MASSGERDHLHQFCCTAMSSTSSARRGLGLWEKRRGDKLTEELGCLRTAYSIKTVFFATGRAQRQRGHGIDVDIHIEKTKSEAGNGMEVNLLLLYCITMSSLL